MWKSRRRICISYVYFLPLSLLFSSQKKVFLEFENQFLFSFFFTFLSPSTFTVQKLIFQKRFSNVFPASNIKPKRELFFAFQYHELDWHPRKNFKTIFFLPFGIFHFLLNELFFPSRHGSHFSVFIFFGFASNGFFFAFFSRFFSHHFPLPLGDFSPIGIMCGDLQIKKEKKL